jgi:chromate transporter
MSSPAVAAPTLTEAFRFWLKLGFISFGGPAGQIGIMHQELVERRRWISEHRFLHALNYTMVLPGPEAQQLATYIGWLLHGAAGGLIAGSLFVLPSFFIICALAWIYLLHHDLPLVAGIFYGIKPAVTAVVLFAAIRIGRRALRSHTLRAMAVLAFIAIFAFHVPFPWIVLGAGLIGLFGAHFAPAQFQSGQDHAGASGPHVPALIDDDTPLPEYARFSWPRAIGHAIAGLGLWFAVLAGLQAGFGWQGTLTQMGWFFTKAALLTFGGAYAVLPYVYQGGVEHYGWITAAQMIDGLALGETTPGPLIMIVTFVGFVGGWTAELFGPGRLVLAGAAGAAVATFFTFLPSFLFILAGAPAVEATRHEIRLSAPLSGITAAVVGVVLNLAMFFAWHVFWPQGWQGTFDWLATLMCAAALIALVRFQAGIVPVIGACAAAGLVRMLFV